MGSDRHRRDCGRGMSETNTGQNCQDGGLARLEDSRQNLLRRTHEAINIISLVATSSETSE